VGSISGKRKEEEWAANKKDRSSLLTPLGSSNLHKEARYTLVDNGTWSLLKKTI